MAVTNTLVESLKLVLMSTGVVFIAILISLSFPKLLSSASATASSADLSTLWSGIQAWLRPPYLYFIINAIIIIIVVSSRLHHHRTPSGESALYGPPLKTTSTTSYQHHQQQQQHDVISVVPTDQFSSPYDAVSLTAEIVNSATAYYGVVSSVKPKDVDVEVEVEVEVVRSERVVEKRESRVAETPIVTKPAKIKAPTTATATAKVKSVVENREIHEFAGRRERLATVEERSEWTTPPPLTRQKPVAISPDFMSERPPASSRFGHHRRPAKAHPAEGGTALRKVAKPNKQDTLETTWKAITEGRHMPLTRHLIKKSDTWENHHRQINLLDDHDHSFPPPVKKSETFKDRTNHASPPAAPKLKKEPSLSQDELNRRVEAFINKFNEEMRLQRQQSIQQFMEKINRAA